METDHRKKIFRIILFLAAIVLLVKITRPKEEPLQLQQLSGQTMGTIVYNVKFLAPGNPSYQYGIDSVLKALNQSQSTYIADSEISRFNRSDTLFFESALFYPVLKKSEEIHQKTSGAFDPTIGPLINALGFGPDKKNAALTTEQVAALLQKIGFQKLIYTTEFIVKPAGMYLDFSAIAKGYAVDLVGEYLKSKGVVNFMVEIGGEVLTMGVNEKNKPWSIGIENPLVSKEEQQLMAIATLENMAVATSGNYRNYYEKDGKTFAHIVDPRTGYSGESDLLSASVFATTCMESDAYATAFMVLGLEETKAIVEKEKQLDVLLVYRETGSDSVKIYVSENMKSKTVITQMPVN